MKFPFPAWAQQLNISLGDISGNVATAVGADDAIYFAVATLAICPIPATPSLPGQPPSEGVPPLPGAALVTQGLYTPPSGAFPPLTPDLIDSLTNPCRNTTYNIAVGKITRTGTPQWILVSPAMVTTTNDITPAIITGPSGQVYVAYGTQDSTYNNLNMTYVPNFCNKCLQPGPADIVLARIDEVEGQPSVTWVKQNAQLNSCNDESVPQLAIDPTNQLLYVALQTSYAIQCFTAIGQPNIVLSCFDLNGKQLWTEAGANLNSTGQNTNPAIAADTQGGVYVAFETTGQIQGGAIPPTKQIEVVRYQTLVSSPGVSTGYFRSWVYSGTGSPSLFATNTSQTPSLAFSSMGVLAVAYTTSGTVPGGTRTASMNDLVVAGIKPNGSQVWIQQGPVFRHGGALYTNCCTPTLSSDFYGNLYCGLRAQSMPATILVVFKLSPFDGTPTWNYTKADLTTYNAYPFAQTGGPNAALPSGLYKTKVVVSVCTDSIYMSTVVPVLPTATRPSPYLNNLFVAQIGIGNYAQGQTAYEYMIDFVPTIMGQAPPSLLRR